MNRTLFARTLFATAAVAVLAAAPASAADLPGRSAATAPAPVYSQAPLFTWTGFYAGVNAGYGFGGYRGPGGNNFGNANGGVIGGTLGYNYQAGNIVFGAEGDWDFNGTKSTRAIPGLGTLAGVATSQAQINNMLTARGRIGYAADRALLFVTGGYAGANLKGTITDPTIPATFSNSSWRNGYALGGGIEYAFTRNISAKAEYLYTSFGSKTEFAAPWASNVDAHQNLIRAGLNYHF